MASKDKKSKEANTTVIEKIKILSQNKRGRAILFFLFYFIFFALLILMLRNNNEASLRKKEKTSTSTINESYNFDLLEQGNYRFTRTETRNGEETVFVGETNSGRGEILMTRNNTLSQFFYYDDIVLQKQMDRWQVAANPYLYPKTMISSYLKKILNTATLKSKTTYEGGNTFYNYEISTTSLIAIIDSKEIDISDPVNKIQVEVNSLEEIVNISLDLTSYHQYLWSNEETLHISINYRDYGKVKELEIPE